MKNNIISGFGAFLCISALAYLNSYDESNLWLIPPFGASMVLVMAAHGSPLAHPKNVFFGHIISAFSGVFVLYPHPSHIYVCIHISKGVVCCCHKKSWSLSLSPFEAILWQQGESTLFF